MRALGRDFERLERSAERVAHQPERSDLAAERVEQLNVRRDAQAQTQVLRTADEMLGLILDLKA